jgi:NAD(P)-dependent dehydrogenase (short-subunit alcohol dehydrogenase family)
MKRLSGKTALITGAGSGIGRAIAEVFAREGARIAVADINSESAEATLQKLPTEGLVIAMDVASKTSVQEGVQKAIAHFGKLDILVNNAGCVTFSSFEDCSEELWDRVIDINLKGTFLCIQAVLPHMKKRGSGVVINMSSLAAKTGGIAAGPAYAASKAGISALTLGLARAEASNGIRAVGIAPGIIDTPMTSSGDHEAMKAQIPLKEIGRPEDVANCALFLASDEARHITGEIIDVNGGLFMD